MKKKHAWKGKEIEYYIILDKLSKGVIFERKDFEKPKKKVSDYSGIEEELVFEEVIPHTSVIHRLEFLKEKNFVRELKHERYSKNGKPIPRYQIAVYGFIELFRLGSILKKGNSFTNVKQLLPAFSNEFESLKKIFSEEQMSNILYLICKNFTIKIDTYQKKDFKNIKGIPKSMLETSTSIQIHEIKIKISQQDPYHSITEKVILSKKKRNDKYSESLRPNIVTRQLIIFALFYELLKGINDKTCEIKTSKNSANNIILNLIRSNGVFNKMLSKYLGMIQDNLYQEIEQINDIIKKI